MAITKYASFEMSAVLDIKGSPTRARTASLDKLSDFHDYRTEDGYLYARIRAISSRVNKNHDGWPSIELAGSQDIFDRHYSANGGGFTVEAQAGAEYGYSTFLGKPIFIDHHNSDPERARGVIVDAKLHVEDHRTAASLDPYYASAPDNHTPPTWVELLLEVDAKSFPKLAKAILEGSTDSKKGIDGFSMGCDVEKSVCNICKNAATAPDEYCNHIKMKGAEFDYIEPKTGRKTSKKSYEDCYGVRFFEISAVFDPADETALIREVVNKESKVAGPGGGYGAEMSGMVECPHCGGAGQFDEPSVAQSTGEEFPFTPCPHCDSQGFQRSYSPGSDGAAAPHVNQPLPPEAYPQMPSGIQDRLPTQRLQGHTASVRTADNPLPQADLIKAPEDVDTLRDEQICPVCGSHMDETTCDVCGYVEPPENFNNPDLTKAKEEDDIDLPDDVPFDAPPEPGPETPADMESAVAKNPQSLSHVKNDMARWQLSVHPKVAGKINPVERPILPGNPQGTNEPKEEILEDHNKPVTSSMRTARQLMAAAQRNKENNMNQRTAAEPVPAAKPDTRGDVEGTGGYIQDSNESASKADAQINVDGVGGTGVEAVSADQENVEVEQGNEHSKNIEAIPTKTFPNEGQQDPVTSEPFIPSGEGVHKSHDNAPFPSEDGGLAGGGANKGTQPVDPVGKAQDRVDVLDTVTSPENNSGATKTWSGTDGNGVTKQQDPVSSESLEGADGVKKSHIFMAFKLADLEVEMGLLDPNKKYERAAELEAEPVGIVQASLKYAQKVKTAGLSRGGSRVARRMPPMAQPSTMPREASVEQPVADVDEGLFL